VCRHRAGPLALEDCALGAFRCKYHGWTYQLDGTLFGVPDFDGVENFERESFSLREVRLGDGRDLSSST